MIQQTDSATAIPILLEAIEENHLTVLCGAGLSMAAPSKLPSTLKLAQDVYDKCQASGVPGVTNNIEQQAQHFLNVGRFAQYFIGSLIPLDSFSSPPNQGHHALADFLLCRAIACAISTNVDNLIEGAGNNLNGMVQGFLDGAEASQCPNDRSPLLKIHGCWVKEPTQTVWAPMQREMEPIKTRIDNSKNWLTLTLANKTLLVVGFWSDWAYLNSIFESTLGTVSPSRVIIVDPSSTAALEGKAPGLCALGDRATISYLHVQMCGSSFLDELRKSFSRRFFRQAVYLGATEYTTLKGSPPAEAWLDLPNDIDTDSLYALRRDIEGREPREHAKNRQPDPANTLVGLALMQLRAKGATSEGRLWRLGERRIRLLRSSKSLHNVKEIFGRETPPANSPDIVVCVGSEDMNLPGNITRMGEAASVVRGGPAGRWLTLGQAVEELDL